MPLNKSGSNMLKDHFTWNALSGECEHKCVYCYVEGMKTNPVIVKKYSGEPSIVEKELKENLYKYGEGITIFVQNMSDLFADNVSYNDIARILYYCKGYPKNTYLFQTKNPRRFNEFFDYDYPPNTIKGTTIESNRDYPEISKAPLTLARTDAMISTKGRKQVIIEPILKFDLYQLTKWMLAIDPEIIYIGADSKRNNLPEPTEKEVVDLYKVLKSKFDVKSKSNLRRIAPSLF